MLRISRWAGVSLLILGILASLSFWLRRLPYEADRAIYGYFEIVGSVLALTFAANALVRFRGKQDRVALLLAHGFVVAGVLETLSGLSFYFRLADAASAPVAVPLEWTMVRTFLAALLLVTLYVEHRLPQPRNPRRELFGTIVIVIAVMYLTVLFYGAAAYLGVPLQTLMSSGSLVPRPGQLLPVLLFFFAAVGFRRRLKDTATAFDRAIYLAAAMNAFSHFMASQAEQLFDAPSALAQLVRVSSYAIVLGGALLDNVRLFDQVRHMASSDPLTGLANYRRFLDVLGTEMERSRRTRRPFAVLFLDLDGLKRINDTYGHAVGSRAICRMADALRSHCRAVDTAARYGGDEFALILPETAAEAAACVVERIKARLTAEAEAPMLSASIGVAVYPRNGDTLEKLLATADRLLYAMKKRQRRRGGKKAWKEVAA
ncbi:MAG: GGDEF domain-containing protein [Acidobacteria bacterium]|nr:GGDEF domain-containing protein [Acidobacteriota bacterium]MBI3661847.1 GGDEF domain-containing protein [Acidobacteriota bacterium]